MTKITSKTTIKSIAEDVEFQFGITDTAELKRIARAVKAAHKSGTLLWTDAKLVTTDRNALNLRAVVNN